MTTLKELDLSTIFFLMVYAREARKAAQTRRSKYVLKEMERCLSWVFEEAAKAQKQARLQAQMEMQATHGENVISMQDYIRRHM